MAHRILTVDDDRGHRSMLQAVLSAAGYEVVLAAGGKEAVAAVEREPFDIILMDIRMRSMDGLEALRRIKPLAPDTPVVLMTAYASVRTAVEALRNGAEDYLTKPLDIDELKVVLEKVLRFQTLQEENRQLREALGSHADFSSIVGSSPKMLALFDTIGRVAPTEATVLISGESGTGKELIALAIHSNSPRKDGPFVAVNCAALPETLLESEIFGHERGAFTGADKRRMGRFEMADGGTIFLDEIGELSVSIQAKLLRVIQEMAFEPLGSSRTVTVDARVLAATNKDLEEEIREGRFREDLFYRLNVVRIRIPPLRERTEDILPLAQLFIERFNRKNQRMIKGLGHEAAGLLQAYDWPGNVRELENVIERSVILCRGETIGVGDLPEPLRNLAGSPEEPSEAERLAGRPLKEVEAEMIRLTLRQNDGNRTRTAEILGISRRTLQHKLKAYGIR
ncbi:MAG: sigma-54-dependent transcriptional regulator [Desulfobacterales bacterium]